ncbi:MAG: hypothetical protein QOI89_2045 [Solirubrobacteraceae bacterium]|jgi:hypothetical protein|nr:hypothetical protein [Solirubrobacteraceae bacterium]
MYESRWERLAPLTGIVFVAIVVAVFAIGGSTPEEHDSAAKVQAYYAAHHDKHTALAFVMAIGVAFLVFFASTLRHDLRRLGGTGQLSDAAFGGGVLAAAGFAILATVHVALANAGESVTTLGTTQTLNVLDNNDFIPAAAGLAVLVFAAGAAAVRHGGLPKWLGWLGIVIGVVAFTPAGFVAFLAAGIWILIVSVLLTQARQGSERGAEVSTVA